MVGTEQFQKKYRRSQLPVTLVLSIVSTCKYIRELRRGLETGQGNVMKRSDDKVRCLFYMLNVILMSFIFSGLEGLCTFVGILGLNHAYSSNLQMMTYKTTG